MSSKKYEVKGEVRELRVYHVQLEGWLTTSAQQSVSCGISNILSCVQAKRDDDSVDTETTEDSDGQDDDTELVSTPVCLLSRSQTANKTSLVLPAGSYGEPAAPVVHDVTVYSSC